MLIRANHGIFADTAFATPPRDRRPPVIQHSPQRPHSNLIYFTPKPQRRGSESPARPPMLRSASSLLVATPPPLQLHKPLLQTPSPLIQNPRKSVDESVFKCPLLPPMKVHEKPPSEAMTSSEDNLGFGEYNELLKAATEDTVRVIRCYQSLITYRSSREPYRTSKPVHQSQCSAAATVVSFNRELIISRLELPKKMFKNRIFSFSSNLLNISVFRESNEATVSRLTVPQPSRKLPSNPSTQSLREAVLAPNFFLITPSPSPLSLPVFLSFLPYFNTHIYYLFFLSFLSVFSLNMWNHRLLLFQPNRTFRDLLHTTVPLIFVFSPKFVPLFTFPSPNNWLLARLPFLRLSPPRTLSSSRRLRLSLSLVVLLSVLLVTA